MVLFKMALLGWLYGIPSERRLAGAVRLKLTFLWFVGSDLDDRPPDHSVLSKARARFGVTVSQAFFTESVRQCEQAGLVRGERLSLDSTLTAANASLDSVGARAGRSPGQRGEPPASRLAKEPQRVRGERAAAVPPSRCGGGAGGAASVAADRPGHRAAGSLA